MKLILVSHVEEFAKSTKKYILKMVKNSKKEKILAVGGDIDGGIGTDYKKIIEAIKSDKEDTLIICDLGSAILSSEAAISMVNTRVHISNGSFVEGAFSAATLMFADATFENVILAAEEKIFKK